jgi:hypothetical protein
MRSDASSSSAHADALLASRAPALTTAIDLDGRQVLVRADNVAVPAPPTVDLDALGLTCTVEEAARVLGISRAAAYRAAGRFRATHGVEGLPILLLGERRMLVSVPALRRLLETGVPPSRDF